MGLFRLFQKKETKFYIGEGIVTMWNNRIPIKAISNIQVVETKDKPIILWFIIAAVGIGFCFNRDYRTLGMCVIFLGLLKSVSNFVQNALKEHYLQLQVHSGRMYTFAGRDLEFLRTVLETICDIINHDMDRVLYVDCSTNVIEKAGEINVNKLYQENTNSFNQVAGDFIAGAQNVVTKGDHANAAVGNHGNVNQGSHAQQSNSVISNNEWNTLETFFTDRCRELGREHPEYENCLQMRRCAKERDASGLKQMMHRIGTTSLKVILGAGVDQVVKMILSKVLKLG